jgi:hypothetical protein
MFPGFSEANLKPVLALLNRRNEELHSGAAAFDAYPPRFWLLDFYKACRWLTDAMGETLETLFGKAEAQIANGILDEAMEEATHRVQTAIAAHRKVFDAKSPDEKRRAAEEANTEAERLAHQRRHRVKCPACSSTATVQGEPFGPEHVAMREDDIEIRQAVAPRSFSCSACGLKLTGYAELDAAQLGGYYTRTTTESPADYYGLVDMDTIDYRQIAAEYIGDHPDFIGELYDEYDNE